MTSRVKGLATWVTCGGGSHWEAMTRGKRRTEGSLGGRFSWRLRGCRGWATLSSAWESKRADARSGAAITSKGVLISFSQDWALTPRATKFGKTSTSLAALFGAGAYWRQSSQAVWSRYQTMRLSWTWCQA